MKIFKIQYLGNEVEVEFILESREYNGKWYTNASMWSCKKAEAAQASAQDLGDDSDGDLPWD